MADQEPIEGSIVRDKDGVPWLHGGGGVWRSDGRYRPWDVLVEDFGPVEIIYTPPAEPAKVTVHFKDGPWHGKTAEVERVTAPVFAVGHEVGNYYWLDTKSDPPLYFWNGGADA